MSLVIRGFGSPQWIITRGCKFLWVLAKPTYIFYREEQKIFERGVLVRVFVHGGREGAMESFGKQPYEAFVIAGDYKDVLESTESLILGSSAVSAMDKDGVDASADVLVDATKTVDGPLLKMRCKAGTMAKQPYKITFRTVTDQNNKWEIDVRMRIKEI